MPKQYMQDRCYNNDPSCAAHLSAIDPQIPPTHTDKEIRESQLSQPCLDVLADLGVRARLVRRLHAADLGVVLSVGRVRDPLCRVARRRLLEHAVDLLQTEALCLGDEEECEEHTGSTCGAPDEEDLGLEVALIWIHQVGRDEADDEVPEPVGLSMGLARARGGESLGRTYQFDAVERATPLERMGRGKISPIRTQAPGPQVVAKKKM